MACGLSTPHSGRIGMACGMKMTISKGVWGVWQQNPACNPQKYIVKVTQHADCVAQKFKDFGAPFLTVCWILCFQGSNKTKRKFSGFEGVVSLFKAKCTIFISRCAKSVSSSFIIINLQHTKGAWKISFSVRNDGKLNALEMIFGLQHGYLYKLLPH